MSTAQGMILKLLQEELATARQRNPRYSMRAFSKRLGMPVSALSGILNGKLPITLKSAERITKALAISPQNQSTLLQGLKQREAGRKLTPVLKAQSFSELDVDQFHLICDWYYFGILSLATTKGFQSDVAWIAQTLGIQKRQATNAVSALVRLGMLARDTRGKITPTGKHFQTSSPVPNSFVRKHHFEGLELAQRSMEEDDFSACDFSSITMGIHPEKIPEAKKMITDFRKSLCAFLESGPQEEVYRMSIQLFPLSNREKLSKNKTKEKRESK